MSRATQRLEPSLLEASDPVLVELARELFVEYEQAIGVDLCFQGFAEELAGLPGAYAPPGGALLLAYFGPYLAGCGALRPLDDTTAEMKRLYVRPAARGRAIGRRLATRLIEAAAALGYTRLRLDTLATMSEAIGLYRSLGFVEIPAYRHNPLGEAMYFEKDLSK